MPEHVYMDHAATTDMLPEALDAYVHQMRRGGNPASLHSGGRSARMALENGREQIAVGLGAEPVEVIMTSGGTEADNMGVLGLYRARRSAQPVRNVVVLSPVEHQAVIEAAQWLNRHEGAQLVWLKVDDTGKVDPTQLHEVLENIGERVALVAVMWANNEVGTVQPVAELGEVCSRFDVAFHVDAVQAFGSIPIDAGLPGISTLAVSAHKLGGPVGVGALYAPRSVRVEPSSYGGGQERDVRSGTVNAAGAAAFGAAVEASTTHLSSRFERLARLRDRLVAGVQREVPEAVLRGATPGSVHQEVMQPTRLPGNAHFTFPGCEGDSILFLFDAAGIATSTGSACNAGVPRPSSVLLAMGVDEETARGAQRFSLGHTTTDHDVDVVIDAVAEVYSRARSAGLSGHVPTTGAR